LGGLPVLFELVEFLIAMLPAAIVLLTLSKGQIASPVYQM
jgi:hypothetical protein